MKVQPPSGPDISVIIPTFNRAGLLKPSLESLASQSLDREAFEVVVIDDGSTDETREVCREMESRLSLRYFRIENSGISAAKNLGIFVSAAPILLFFDDDDVADKDLLREHLRVHRENPEQNVAVLGYTTWSPSLEITEIMNYVTEIGNYLFAYGHFKDGQVLGYKEFWGGRTSCKRALLVREGIFNQGFTFGSEDIELGYRLSRFGLKVVFSRHAIQYMNRAVTFDEFCRRCEKQGKSQVMFSGLHNDREIQQYCQVVNADVRWREMKRLLDAKVKRVHEIESVLASQTGNYDWNALLQELRSLYRWTFEAFKLRGIVQTLAAAESRHDLPVDSFVSEHMVVTS